MRRLLLVAAAIAVCLLALTGVVRAETIQVTTTEDLAGGAASCPGATCTLRRAITDSESGDTVQLGGTAAKPALYELTLGSQIVLDHSLTIEGAGVAATTVSGFGNRSASKWNRILKVDGDSETPVEVSIEGLTFTGGLDENDENCTLGCTTLDANGGGALYNAGASVSLSGVAFALNGTESSGQSVGGAIANEGELEMVDVSFREDRAAFGGGLFAHAGTVVGNRVTFASEGETASGGGAVFIYRGGIVNLRNTTVTGSGSPSGFGGGIVNAGGTLVLNNDTLAGNTRGSLETDEGASTSVQNTIIASGESGGGIDFDCVAAGKETNAGTTTSSPISEDLGHTIDQDGVCGLDAGSDQSGVDPRLAPIADNGGAVETDALLSESPALENGNAGTCAPTDARGVKRPSGKPCDVGAFEAVFRGPPSATTDAPTGLGEARVNLHGTFDLAGEAGGYHFQWGTVPEDLVNQTPEAATGIVDTGAPAQSELRGLEPSTTYYYELVADNASGSATGSILHFTTTSEEKPPTITKVTVGTVTEHSAEIKFTINPHGGDTTYEIEYGVDSAGEHHTEPVDIGSEVGPQKLSQTLEGLSPGTTYDFRIFATNPVTDGVQSEQQIFETGPELGPPTFSEVTVSSITERSAKIEVTINPNGHPTSYSIVYGTDSVFEHQTEFVEIGSGTDPVEVAQTIEDLAPDTTYKVEVGALAQGFDEVFSEPAEFTTEPAAGPPSVEEVTVASVTASTAKIDFAINPNGADTNYVVEYGPDTNREEHTKVVDIGAGREAHELSAELTGLKAQTTYHFEVNAKNAFAGEGVHSEDQTFTTVGPPVISEVKAGGVTETTGDVEFTIDPAGLETTYEVEYGPTAGYGQSTAVKEISGRGGIQKLLETIAGLEPNHTYHFRIVASNAEAPAGVQSSDHEFTTAPGPPVITEVKAGPVTATTGKVEFTIDPAGSETTYEVEYGPTADYGQATTVEKIAGGAGAQNLAETIAALEPNQTYHFRVAASNAQTDGAVHSTDHEFKTTAGVPVITEVKAGAVTGTTATVEFTLDPAGSETTYEVEYGPTIAYGQKTPAKKIAGGAGAQKLAETIAGLEPFHTYHFRITATNPQAPAGGVHSADEELKTAAGPPVITEVKAGAVTGTTAKAEFALDPQGSDTTYEVEYGPTAAYGQKTPAKKIAGGAGLQKLVETIAGLTPFHTYHFRITATNPQAPAGGVHSADGEFKTAAGPPVITEVKSSIAEVAATIEGTIDPAGSETTYEVEYGPTVAYGQKTPAKKIAGGAGPQKVAETIAALEPNHTYHFRVTAANPQAPAGGVHSADQEFTTGSGKPIVSEVKSGEITNTTATIEVAIDPNGADTTYVVEYGTDTNHEQNTEAVDIGGGPGVQHLQQTLTGLTANTIYHFVVVAKNGNAPTGVISPEQEFTTFGAPVVSGITVTSTTETTATITFTIEPAGFATTYVIQYGPTTQYGQETAPEGVGAGREPVQVTRTLTGLEAGHTYHFAVIASNQDAATGERSPDVPFTTVAKNAGKGTGGVGGTKEKLLPPPVFGKTFNIEPVSGKVYVELPLGGKTSGLSAATAFTKGKRFIPLTEARQLPFGSILEATAGIAKITTATSTPSKFQFGDFGAGIFKLLQSRKQHGLTQLNIINNRSRKVCATIGKKASAAKLRSKVLGRLKGSAHGKFVTKGQYSAATVRGTVWSVTNQCNGTLTKVTRDTVIVRDFARRKTITLHTGQSYLARAPKTSLRHHR